MYEHIYICTLYGSDNPIYYKQQSIIVCAFQELFWFAERPRHRFHFLLLLFLLLSLLAPIVEHLCSITTPSSVCFSGILTLRKMNSCSCPSPWCCFYYLVPLRLGQDRTTKKKCFNCHHDGNWINLQSMEEDNEIIFFSLDGLCSVISSDTLQCLTFQTDRMFTAKAL